MPSSDILDTEPAQNSALATDSAVVPPDDLFGTPCTATYSWLSSLVAHAYTAAELTADDMPRLPPQQRLDSAPPSSAATTSSLDHAVAATFSSRLYAVLRKPWRRAIAFQCVYVCCQLCVPLLLYRFVQVMQDSEDIPESQGWALIVLLPVLMLVGGVAQHAEQQIMHSAGRYVRAQAMLQVYDAAMVLPSTELDQGQTVTMVSADSQKLFEVAPFINQAWAAPVLIIASLSLIAVMLGWAATLTGFMVLVLLVPLNGWIMKRFHAARAPHLRATDARGSLLQSVVAAINAVKYFSWDGSMYKAVQAARETELRWVTRELMLFGLNICVIIIGPVTATVSALSVAALTETLTTSTAFAALALFNVLRFPMNQLGLLTASLSQCKSALVRIDRLVDQAHTARQATDGLTLLSSDTPGEQASSAAADAEQVELRDAAQSSTEPTVWLDMRSVTFRWPHLRKSKESSKDMKVKPAPVPKSKQPRPAEASDEPSDSEAEQSQPFTVGPMTMTLAAGQLACITGPVASGKSTLVSGILGEVPQLRAANSVAQLSRARTIAYAPQEPVVFNQSVQDNVTFGRPFLPQVYAVVLWACGLDADVANWPGRHMCVIGEKGRSLSGGQQQRVSLARAVYAMLAPSHVPAGLSVEQLDAQVAACIQSPEAAKPGAPANVPGCAELLLADDQLSAQDAATGANIFARVFSKFGILKHCARVLVTHAGHVLEHSDQLICLADGCAVYCGPTAGVADLLAGHAGKSDTDRDANLTWLASTFLSAKHDESVRALTGGMPASPCDITDEDVAAGKLMLQEGRGRGNVGLGVLWVWIKASGGMPVVAVLLALLVLERAAYMLVELWVATWVPAMDAQTKPDRFLGFELHTPTNSEVRHLYIPVYVCLLAATAIAVAARVMTFMMTGKASARLLHDNLVRRLLRAPMSFFDQTPAGRLMNHCMYDTEVIDFLLPRTLVAALASLGWLATGLCIMIIATPFSLLGIVPVLGVFYMLQLRVRRTVRECQRLEAMSLSPLLSHMGACFSGGPVIRGLGSMAVSQQRHLHQRLNDANARTRQALTTMEHWAGVRLVSLGAVACFTVTLAAWLLRDSINPGIAAMAVMWGFGLSTSFGFWITMSTQAESKLVSVERIHSFAQQTPQEAPLYAPGDDTAVDTSLELSAESPARTDEAVPGVPPKDWPSAGEVVFDKAVMSYRPDLPPALRSISLRVPGGQHLGVCGASGAGKSSLGVALFRLVELDSGSITVDGVDLHSLGLHYVRGHSNGICLIQQQPHLTGDTVQAALDPFSQHTAEEIDQALSMVGMLPACTAAVAAAATQAAELAGVVRVDMVPPREAPLAEGGTNFSLGQRQLLALARCLLQQPKVLLRDEYSASLDSHTERVIQDVLQEALAGTTLITIAHRLQTLAEVDTIAVMELGQVAALGKPIQLARQVGGPFHKLLVASGGEAAVEAFVARVHEHQAQYPH